VAEDDPLVVEGRRAIEDGLAWAAERIAALASGQVLDVGCGEGRFLPVGGVGLDLDESRLRAARARSGRLVHGDAHALPFGAESFDTVLANRMLNDAGRIDDVLREIRRVLRPGGRLLALTLATSEPSPLREIHDRALEALGLQRPRGRDRLDDANGAARLGRHFGEVQMETFRRAHRFADAAAALDHYARHYLRRGSRSPRETAALFADVRERVRAWRGPIDDEERAVLFVARA
jgi:SAM-dependent methyltransferase